MRDLNEAASTRRELLWAGLSAGTVVAAVPAIDTPAALARPRTDADVVHRLLAIEQVVAFAYAHVLSSGVLSAAVVPMMSRFAAHEQQHVAAWDADLQRLRGSAPRPPASVAGADRQLTALHVTSSLARLRTQRGALELLIGAEAAIIGAYYVAIAKLADASLLQMAAQAMAAEAQHATALRRLLHPRTVESFVPSPFVQGRH